MNPLIRLCGLKRRHGENDLLRRAGILNCYSQPQFRRMTGPSYLAAHGVVSATHIAAQLPADLRKARTKSAMDSRPYMLSPVKQTREARYGMPRGHDPDALPSGGASVVVRGGESPLHGKGKQFKHVCVLH
ncbi:hypothetical protein IMCC3135_22635 [Granulosicoccus antarcticus IMCC3135]|uniref:Uncharacterized protein n=1 Tax=Granulosicoccus antarcticus IMCC3135 TaxID=1192854 RepID=A0A2Z2P250_9GAMM|nr:hypothetical protein IMCC3135_22635 [Granulosicoccus antarcticus IMCC3135]